MKKILLTFAILSILTLSLAGAVVNQTINIKLGIREVDNSFNQTSTSITDSQAIGYICNNADCSSVSTQMFNGQTLSSGSNSFLNVQYPTTLQGTGYGLFFYKPGYIPYEIKSTFAGAGQVSNDTAFLGKKRICEAQLTGTTFTQNNGTIRVNTQVISPISNAGPLNFIPPSLANIYSVRVQVRLETTGNTTYTEIKTLQIPYSGQPSVAFSFPGNAGNTNLKLSTFVDDVQCLLTLMPENRGSLFIPATNNSNNGTDNNQTNQTNQSSPIFLSIISPQSITYNTTNILVNISAINATNLWYSLNNGQNITYTMPVFITAQEGSNILRAFANNTNSFASTSVGFSIILPSSNQSNQTNQTNQSDLTPPGPVSNLRATSVQKNFITWNWTNPSDSDFSQAIVYLNGVNVANTSNNFYYASGLQSNTQYSIRINTKDVAGNVNYQNVSNTQTTLSSSTGSNNGGNGGNDGKKKTFTPLPILEDEVIPVIPFEEEIAMNNTINLAKKKVISVDFTPFIWLLALLCLLLLILIILIAAMGTRRAVRPKSSPKNLNR